MIWALLAAAVALGVLALPYTATQLLRGLETHQPLRDPAHLEGVGAIVVLGGDFFGNAPEMGGETVGPLTLQRLHYAARLHRQSNVPLLLTGGVIGRNGRPLAESMAQVLAQDFNRTAQWLDRSSRNTRENAQHSRASLNPHGIHRICLVTHGWHMVRAMKAFVRQGFDVLPAPTLCVAKPAPLLRDFIPGGTALSRSLLALREWSARAWYAVLVWRESAGASKHDASIGALETDVAYVGTSSPAASRMNAIARSNPGSDE
jgi:uncharacterized SAM-binding protein YcdF (DUF218 family)